MSKRPVFHNTLVHFSMCLTANPETPFWYKIHSKNSFYGHPFPPAVSIRAAKKIEHLGGYLVQCRSVNPYIRTGVFNPFKLTDRSVIIGSLVLLHVTALLSILLQKLLYHISKQCRPLSAFFHSPSALCLRWIFTVCQNPLYVC